MKTTKHALARMSQRGSTKKLVDLAFESGKGQGDKLILNRKTTQKLINEIDKMRQELLKVMDKGGITIVVNGDTLITTYNTNSYRRS